MTDAAVGGRWDPDQLRRIADAEEVVIETKRRSGDARRTIIWIVADDQDVYVRSVRGADGWWYRDLQARPTAAFVLDGDPVDVRAIPAEDPESVQRVSELLRQKYGATQKASTAAMLQPHTLPTTLRLDPA